MGKLLHVSWRRVYTFLPQANANDNAQIGILVDVYCFEDLSIAVTDVQMPSWYREREVIIGNHLNSGHGWQKFWHYLCTLFLFAHMLYV